jgi:hypothetical protein
MMVDDIGDNGDIVNVRADFQPRPAQDLMGRTPREIMRALLDAGYGYISLTGALIEQASPGITVFVEDDADLLIGSYLHFEDVLGTPAPYEFDVFLGEGLLEFTSKSEDHRSVTLEFKYYEGADVANLSSWSTKLLEQKYTWWWRSIAAGLLSYLDPPG